MATIVCEELDGKFFRFSGPHIICGSYSAMLLQLITGLKVYCSVKVTNLKTYQGWENGSIGNVLALQEEDPSLSPRTEHYGTCL